MRTRTWGAASPSPTGSTGAPAPSTGGKSYLRRGAAAFEEAERNQAEIERRKSQGGNVLRFYVKQGDECEVIILDESLDKAVAFYEHNLQGPDGKWGVHEPCIKDFAECPLCANGSVSYYGMMLSVLVLKPFTINRGKPNEKVIPHSKMLLPVKIGQFDLFRRLEAAAKKECGTMRGMYLVLARSKTDAKSSRIGEPIILESGKMFDMLSEKELLKDYGHKAVMAQDGKSVSRAENFDITAYDYEKLFPMPDVAAIMKRYGSGEPATGSVDEATKAFGEEEEQQQQEAPVSTRTRKRGAAEPEPEVRTRAKRGAKSKADENPFD